MFEFFVALFGGLHYGGKILAESAEVKKFDKTSAARIAYHNQRLQLWKSLVSDIALEEDLKFFIADQRNYEEVWKEVHDAYLQMPLHRTTAKIFVHDSMLPQGKYGYTRKQRENIVRYERECALDIMLAKRGKVRKYSAILDGHVFCHLSRGEGQHSKERWDRDFEFWCYISDELCRNGVDARLIFKTGVCGGDHESIAYDADDIERFHYLAGRLTWLPLTWYDDNLKYV